MGAPVARLSANTSWAVNSRSSFSMTSRRRTARGSVAYALANRSSARGLSPYAPPTCSTIFPLASIPSASRNAAWYARSSFARSTTSASGEFNTVYWPGCMLSRMPWRRALRPSAARCRLEVAHPIERVHGARPEGDHVRADAEQVDAVFRLVVEGGRPARAGCRRSPAPGGRASPAAAPPIACARRRCQRLRCVPDAHDASLRIRFPRYDGSSYARAEGSGMRPGHRRSTIP